MVMNKLMSGAKLQILGFTLISSVAMAQQGVFDVKIASQKIDCANRKVLIDVQVKAHDDKSSFLMGDANYRFNYNSSVLRNPTIVKQGHFSNEGESLDAHYGSQNLTGSVARLEEGIVSLNTFYGGTGEGAKTVETAYMTVSTIAFDLIDPKATTLVKWHEGVGKSFPCTGMNQVFLKKTETGDPDYDLNPVRANGSFESLKLNFAEMCSNTSALSTATNGDSFFIPEGFSPDGDGVNDKFVIRNPDGLTMSFAVYDRAGRLMYHQENYQNEWNGKPNQDGFDTDRAVDGGTYYYVVKRADGKTFTRFMTVSY
jgi:gliding motility-associated-like protein